MVLVKIGERFVLSETEDLQSKMVLVKIGGRFVLIETKGVAIQNGTGKNWRAFCA